MIAEVPSVPASQRYAPARGGSLLEIDFDMQPFTVAWEITRACALACVHCRASAIPRRVPAELSTQEALRFIEQVVDIGRPILVVTGGDPMMREDVYELLGYGVQRGLRVALSPSATGRVTRRSLERVRDSGVHMLHVSVDGSTAEQHDGFRGVRGAYQRTLSILREAKDLGFLIQIGTSVSRYNLRDLPAIAGQVSAWSDVWTLFFLVPTGRGRADQMLDASEHEAVLTWLHELSKEVSFHVRTIAAQHYRRVVIAAERQAKSGAQADGGEPPRWALTGAGFSVRGQGGAVPPVMRGVNDGNGFCFVSHTGEVYPSGFLPISAGNVRERSLAEIYRQSPLFRELRSPELLKGKCVRCEYRFVCGGSRARAYAVSGDYLAEDPCCAYVPSAVQMDQPFTAHSHRVYASFPPVD
ncbi:MAG TPA: TIGR04053 family radical SAM/SPASM domain-containing protein [Chloroflexota bacterium]|nr:TIGR04053 family radical SAM/SPASM domain-containing protein [Chloroflexota bacterium]